MRTHSYKSFLLVVEICFFLGIGTPHDLSWAQADGASHTAGVQAIPLSVPQPHVAQPEFSLGPGDELKVTVWGYPELSEQVVILPDGTLSYPLIGSLPASGLTAQRLSRSLEAALNKYIESPQVSLVVTTMRSRRFSVMGEVQRAGVYPLWSDDVTVFEAVAQAGGLGPAALPSEVKVFRQEQGGLIPVDLNSMLIGQIPHQTFTLRSGDVVYVPSFSSRRKVSVLGEVNTPGMYTLQPNMTVIDALSAAGWIRSSGLSRAVMVTRRDPQGNHHLFRIDAQRAVLKKESTEELLLEPGDVVYVPQGMLSKFSNFVGLFTSGVEPGARTYLKVYDSTNPANYVVER